MASHTRGPRGRSRKPRPASGSEAPAGALPADREQAESRVQPPQQRAQPDSRDRLSSRPRPRSRSNARGPVPAHRSYGERPPAPWHPLPLSELLILVGAIAFVVALARLRHGIGAGGPLLFAGLAAVGIGTVEVSWREHNGGFRSHTLLLALLPVVALHSTVVLGVALLSKPSQAVNLGMFAVDIAVFVFLFRLLRTRFLDARARAVARG